MSTQSFIRHRMCSSKNRYNLRHAQMRATSRGLRYYHCPICDAWHLTKKKRGK